MLNTRGSGQLRPPDCAALGQGPRQVGAFMDEYERRLPVDARTEVAIAGAQRSALLRIGLTR